MTFVTIERGDSGQGPVTERATKFLRSNHNERTNSTMGQTLSSRIKEEPRTESVGWQTQGPISAWLFWHPVEGLVNVLKSSCLDFTPFLTFPQDWPGWGSHSGALEVMEWGRSGPDISVQLSNVATHSPAPAMASGAMKESQTLPNAVAAKVAWKACSEANNLG